MSVPLDRLYNYLHDVVNHDIVIYRWNPHGSKKLEDLTLLKETDFSKTITWPIMICHDQEPLNYHQYSKDDIIQYWQNGPLGFSPELVNEGIKLLPVNVAATTGHESLYDCVLITHSEVNSSDLELYQQNHFATVYFWSHGIIARDWFRYAEHDPALKCRAPQQTFLIYNRAWGGTREYRLKFAEMIATQDLAHKCRMGFSVFDDRQSYQHHKFKNSEFCITSTDLEQHFFKNNTLPSASADYCTQDYQETMLEVVLETLFDDSRWHLTEKTLRPIACGHPFILVATPGSLEYLRSYGFETFNGLIDETYDTIQDPVQRLNAIVDEMQRLLTIDSVTWDQLRSIAVKNKQRFFSKEFQEQIIDEFKSNFDKAIDIANAGTFGNRWKTMFDYARHEMLQLGLTHTIDGLDEHTWVTQWLERRRS
jgi:hypothetical protein